MVTKLEKFREEIDSLDTELIHILAKRFDVVRRVAVFKKENHIPVVIPERIEAIKKRCRKEGKALGLTEDFVNRFYDFLIQETCGLEEDLIDSSE